MNYKFLIFIFFITIISIGVVSATDDFSINEDSTLLAIDESNSLQVNCSNLRAVRYDDIIYISGNILDEEDDEVNEGIITIYKDKVALGNCIPDQNGNYLFSWNISNIDIFGQDITLSASYTNTTTKYAPNNNLIEKTYRFEENLDTNVTIDSYEYSNGVYTVKGTVIDENGDPVIGGSAKVTLNGKDYWIPVDTNGKFSFKICDTNNDVNYEIDIKDWGSSANVTDNEVLMNIIEHSELTDYILSLYPQGIPILKFGNGNGPTVVLNSGLHGAELSSIAAIFKLINVLANYGDDINGTIYICPILFPQAVANNTRVYNGTNLNAVANKNGSLSNKIAKFAIDVNADGLGDFHCTRHSDTDVGITCTMCSLKPIYESYLIAKYITDETGYYLDVYDVAGDPYAGALEDYCNINGVPAVTCEALSNHKTIEYGAPELSYNMQKAFLRYFGFNLDDMIEIPLPKDAGKYDLTITYLGEYNYNNSSITLTDAVNIENNTNKNSSSNNINCGNPIALLILGLLAIPIFKRFN